MRTRTSERGMVLVSALLLLLVLTILGVAMFRSYGLLDRIAGNTRERQRAMHFAESAQTFAEWWLTADGGANATSGVTCSAFVTAPSQGQVCSNVLANPLSLPWAGGVTYDLSQAPDGTAATSSDYYSAPQFYISSITSSYNRASGTATNTYQIDALGYGGSANTASVAESGYLVAVTYTTEPPSGPNAVKFVNLGGQ